MDSLTIFTPEGMDADRGALEQIERCIADERATRGALMADHHRGYSMPIGGVVAYDGAVSPSGVGFDIACGNKCVRTNLRAEDVAPAREGLLREVRKRIAFGLGRVNPEPVEHELFERPVWDELERLAPKLKDKAQQQLGTVGSGNHYVDLLSGDDGALWVANHFGSRGLGHTICTGFLNLAKADAFGSRLRESETPTVLELSSALGETYFAAMQLAGEYAYAGRDYVIDQVLQVVGAESTFEVHNHHNYAWREGDEVVVRKGATPLTREPAFIGGSMGDSSVIVRGTGEEIGNIASAPHGAGRVMSRTKAAGRFVKVKRNGRRVRMRDPRTAAIDWRSVQDELRARGIVVLGGAADEAPGVYKPLRDVLAAHPNVQILHTLEPIGVVMAGADEFDPYKD